MSISIHYHGHQQELTFKDGSDVKISRYMRDVIINKMEEFYEFERYYLRIRQLTTCLSIDIELPQRISKLILGEETSKDYFK